MGQVPERAATLDYLLGERHGEGLGADTPRDGAAHLGRLSGLPGGTRLGRRRQCRVLACPGEGGFQRVGEGDVEPDDSLDDPRHYLMRMDRPSSEAGRLGSVNGAG